MNLPKRKNIRLKYYNYAENGYYFVTICTKNKECCFGEITSGKMLLSDYGKNAYNEIVSLKNHYQNIEIDKFVIMPNHIHCIIIVGTEHETSDAATDAGRNTGAASGAPTVGNIVRGYKSGVSRKCGFSVWQRGYYEHIIRNEKDYQEIYGYIENNPAKWCDDNYYV